MRRFFGIAIFVSSPMLIAGAFEEDVLPILKANCMPCHDEHTRTSGFVATSMSSLMTGGTRRGPSVKPGNPEGSPLIQVLRGSVTPRMPMGKSLSSDQIAVIEKWIREATPELAGNTLKTAKYWAFVNPVKPALPPVRDAKWARNDVDYFVLSRLESKGITPSPEADRRIIIRRLYYDLTGLPPSPAEIKSFIEDKSPIAYEDLVERLLKSPHYGERWGKHWLDLARYGDTNGYESDTEFPHAWRYRDYVIDAFNNDKPYDQFVREQIAGDELVKVTTILGAPPPKPEQAVALSFLRLAPFNRTPISEESRDVLLSEMTSTVGSVFLGLTLGCAKCHDHKYDMVPTKDFYRMKAFFSTVQVTRPGEAAEFYRSGEKEWVEAARARYKKELEQEQARFKEFQAPLIEKLAAAREAEKADDKKSEDKKPDDKKKVAASDLAAAINNESNNTVSLESKKEIFTAEEKKQYTAIGDRIAALRRRIQRLEPFAMGVRNAPGPPDGPSVPATFVQVRGEWDQLGERVAPGFLSAITGHSDPARLEIDRYRLFATRGYRITLADWIASAENPLTARVMVNRIWQGHFGRGIVESSSDFGKNGTPPSHPELLDWLASRFIEEKWSIKSMHRLMVNSASYRQSSHIINEQALKHDPENRLLWRFNRQRLDGESIRDNVLAVSGRLNRELGGLPIYPPLPHGVEPLKIKGFGASDVATWETSSGPETLKRSIYIFHRRSQYLPFLETFDAPVHNSSCDRRSASITALQALSMYDSAFTNEESRHFAERVRNETGVDAGEQVRRAFEIAFGRIPDETEQQQAHKFMKSIGDPQEALVGLCRVLLNSNEFLYVD